VIEPEVVVAEDGTVEVPKTPGLGFEVDRDYINFMTESLVRSTAKSII
jgi:L-alanine-DL-glutamate epimerase-like enolase superfamily enzyme